MEAQGTEPRALGLKIRTAGMLNTLHWVDRADHSKPVGNHQLRIMMKAFGTSSLDLSTINGESVGEPNLLTQGVGVVVEKGPNASSYSRTTRMDWHFVATSISTELLRFPWA